MGAVHLRKKAPGAGGRVKSPVSAAGQSKGGIAAPEGTAMPIEGITCEEVWTEISNYVDGRVDAPLRQRMDRHFESCRDCKSVLDGIRNVVKLAGDERAFPSPRNMSQNLRAKLDQFI